MVESFVFSFLLLSPGLSLSLSLLLSLTTLDECKCDLPPLSTTINCNFATTLSPFVLIVHPVTQLAIHLIAQRVVSLPRRVSLFLSVYFALFNAVYSVVLEPLVSIRLDRHKGESIIQFAVSFFPVDLLSRDALSVYVPIAHVFLHVKAYPCHLGCTFSTCFFLALSFVSNLSLTDQWITCFASSSSLPHPQSTIYNSAAASHPSSRHPFALPSLLSLSQPCLRLRFSFPFTPFPFLSLDIRLVQEDDL